MSSFRPHPCVVTDKLLITALAEACTDPLTSEHYTCLKSFNEVWERGLGKQAQLERDRAHLWFVFDLLDVTISLVLNNYLSLVVHEPGNSSDPHVSPASAVRRALKYDAQVAARAAKRSVGCLREVIEEFMKYGLPRNDRLEGQLKVLEEHTSGFVADQEESLRSMRSFFNKLSAVLSKLSSSIAG